MLRNDCWDQFWCRKNWFLQPPGWLAAALLLFFLGMTKLILHKYIFSAMEDNLKKMCNKFSANTFCQSLNCFSIFNLLEAIETRFFVAELFPVGHKKVIEGEPRNNPSEFLSFPIVTWQWNNYKSVTPRTSRVTRPQLTRINLRRSSYQNILVAYIAGISEFLRGSKMCNMPSKKFGSLFKHLSYAKYRGLAVKWGPECCLAQPAPLQRQAQHYIFILVTQ